MSEVKRLRVLIRAIYRGPAWHGPPIRELLSDIDASTAAAHPIDGAHSIWELVLHMTYWRRIVTEALDGGPVDEHPPEEANWPAVEGPDPAAWQEAVDALEASQQALLRRLKTFEDERLSENVTDREYANYFMLHGVVQHDIYHSGQIALLKKAAG
ncbi:MAG: DinB family protein [Acidobacteriota bacterium]